MTIFDAVLTEIRGHRAAELKFRFNRFDFRPRCVLLIEEDRQVNATTLPFVWRFAHESTEHRGATAILKGEGAPVLTVVAAPGVSVQFEGFPSPFYVPGPGLPEVNIYRVQDPAVLPPLASDTPAVNLVGTYEVADRPFVVQIPGGAHQGQPTTTTMTLNPYKHFTVEQLPSGVAITQVFSGDQWTITVPPFTTDPRACEDARARYAFEIDLEGIPEATLSDLRRPILKIVSTPTVQVTLMQRSVSSRFFGVDLDSQAYRRRAPRLLAYHALWEVDNIHQVPPQGAPIEPSAGWRPKQERRVPNPIEQALKREQTLFDLVVGFIPITGDAVDIAELVYGVVTGEDKWGNPLGQGDLALLGLAAVLPFVSGPAVRAMRGLVQRFAEHADEATELMQRVQQAGLSAEDLGVIRRFEAMIKAGRRPPSELWNQALVILQRIPGPRPTIDVLLNADRTGFAHTELQAAYQRYTDRVSRQNRGLERLGQKPQPTRPPAEWASAVTRGRPRELFVTLLGPDYAKRLIAVDAPPRNLLDIPRPDDYSAELLAKHVETALRSERLWERLGRLLAEPLDPGAASLGLLRRQVSTGRFRILKGNLAEIFSVAIQRRELARIAKEHPTARLVSGVRVRLMRDGKPSSSVLFSDNIIIEMKGDRVEVLAVFEVKAGYKGGQEASEQIFEWIERRFTDGSQLVLPKGSTFTSAGGRTWTSKRELSFTWKPEKPGVPTVTGLASAGERHLITARGSSALGVDSGLGVGSKVTRHLLPLTSAQLDYLCAYILLGRSTR